MPNSQDSETLRAPLDKAQEGARLLSAGNYEEPSRPAGGIELYLGSIGARRTLEEAYKRLGREGEAEAYLGRIAAREAMAREPGRRLFFGTVTDTDFDAHLYEDRPSSNYRIRVSHFWIMVSREQYASINVGQTVTFLEAGHWAIFVRCRDPLNASATIFIARPEPEPEEVERNQRYFDQAPNNGGSSAYRPGIKTAAALQKLELTPAYWSGTR